MKRAKLKPTCFFLMANHKSAGSGATTSRIVSAQAQPQAQLRKDLLLCLQSLQAALKTPACSVHAKLPSTSIIGETAGERERT